MDNSNDLIDQTVRELAPSSTNSATAAGQQPERPLHLIDTINQVFALFRLNYHNQFYSAYSDTDLLNQVKRLWLEALAHFSSEQILQGAKRVIETSDYLPTLNRMMQCCEEFSAPEGLPAPRQAYLEACNAPSPKAEFHWSHPLVYHAGLATGWYRLANEPENSSYPAFLEHYRRLARELARGQQLALPDPDNSGQEKQPLSREEARRKLAELKSSLALDN
ncbi:MAG: replication protein P [Porticoccaceae bacterium]